MVRQLYYPIFASSQKYTRVNEASSWLMRKADSSIPSPCNIPCRFSSPRSAGGEAESPLAAPARWNMKKSKRRSIMASRIRKVQIFQFC